MLSSDCNRKSKGELLKEMNTILCDAEQVASMAEVSMHVVKVARACRQSNVELLLHGNRTFKIGEVNKEKLARN